jgi:hypothetical protein
MDRKSLVAGAMIFAVGLGSGVLLTRALTPARGPFGMTGAQYEEARERADLLKASSHMRGVAQAVLAKQSNDPDWTLPPSETELIEILVQNDMITREMIDTWPGTANRPAGEPPFYVVGTLEDVAARDPEAVLLVEHPAHHGGEGGSIVYADTTTVQVDQESLERALEARD